MEKEKILTNISSIATFSLLLLNKYTSLSYYIIFSMEMENADV